MSVRAVPKEISERSPERGKLAEAIENYRQLENEIRAIREAISQTEATRRRAQGVVETTGARLKGAKVAAADAMVAKALGRVSGPAIDLGRLRSEIDAAQDEIDAAMTAEDHLGAKLQEAASQLAHAKSNVDNLLPAVIRSSPELERLFNDYRAAAQAFVDIRNVFANGGLPWGTSLPEDEEFRSRLVLPEPDRELAASWKASIEALKRNPDAELP